MCIESLASGFLIRVDGMLREHDELQLFIDRDLYIFDAYRDACGSLRRLPSAG
ncbi:MAG: hypothetical protein ACOX6T_11820 [Myxococcales bacterium]